MVEIAEISFEAVYVTWIERRFDPLRIEGSFFANQFPLALPRSIIDELLRYLRHRRSDEIRVVRRL